MSLDESFGAEYLEQIEAAAYGGGVIKWWAGDWWRGDVVCDGLGPCKFIPAEPLYPSYGT